MYYYKVIINGEFQDIIESDKPIYVIEIDKEEFDFYDSSMMKPM